MEREEPRPVAPRRPGGMQERVQRFPVTYLLIGLTLLVYLGQWLGEIIFGVDVILIFGAKVNQAIRAGELWRFITPLFVHGSLPHIFVNMYSLFAIGPAVERFFGPRRFLAVYFLSGISGVIMSLGFTEQPSVGASGAIFGLLGALGALLFLNRSVFGQAGSFQLRQIVFVALLNLALGLSPGIDNWGHLGGLITGTALGYFAGPLFAWEGSMETGQRVRDQRPWEAAWPIVAFAAGMIAFLGFAFVTGSF